MELLIALGGVIATVVIALLQRASAKRNQRRLETALEDLRNRIPPQVGVVVERISAKILEASGHVGGEIKANVTLADLNNDGRQELLVDYPSGAHGSVLEMYGFRDADFVRLGLLPSGTPNGFDIGDLNDDGQLEVATVETDWASGKSYADAPRLWVLHRWNGREFVVLESKPYVEPRSA